jgi:hypothetical protein
MREAQSEEVRALHGPRKAIVKAMTWMQELSLSLSLPSLPPSSSLSLSLSLSLLFSLPPSCSLYLPLPLLAPSRSLSLPLTPSSLVRFDAFEEHFSPYFT